MKPKFRAWDARQCKMREVREICFGNNDDIDVYCSGDDINAVALGPDSLMQFTGLLDRIGNEIYKGDMLEWSIYPDGNENLPMRIRDTVTFANGAFTTKERHQLLCTLSPARGIQIVGNVYEGSKMEA